MTIEIILNVYDLSPQSTQSSILNSFGMGFYHTGIEIDGLEYSYGGNFTHSGTGVFTAAPLNVDGAIYKSSYLMGVVRDFSKLHYAIDQVKNEFRANEYNLITQNCNHFSEALCLRLINKRIPSYINRASRFGQALSCFLPKALKD